MLADAGIRRTDCLVTNVINQYVNADEDLCGGRGISGYPPLTKSGHVRRDYIPHLERLGREIVSADPNVVVAMGNVALWALCGQTAITKARGYTRLSTHTAIGFKVLPTFNPAVIIREGGWAHRPTVVMDFVKALRESEFPEIRRPHREIHVPETIQDLENFDRDYLRDSPLISVDIETSADLVTCIGFAPDVSRAIVIPIYDRGKRGKIYWQTKQELRDCFGFIKKVVERPQLKVFQNGLYDISFLYRSCGFKTYGAYHDTMLLHHSLQPEALKSLEYLGSLYTDEGAWKHMRKSSTIKAGA
jgi:hypothetical protein